MALLRGEGLARRPWFEDVALDLDGGEIVVVSGPSGSGKTLFLRTLADLDPADAGTLSLDGRDRDAVPPAEWRQRVLYLHQTAPRLPGTVADNLRRVLDLRAHAGRAADGSPGDGLDPDADADRLSGGEMQRLALTRALALAPDVLLLDEATSALDKDAARAAERRLADWVAAGERAIVWVSHDDDLAERLGARRMGFPS